MFAYFKTIKYEPRPSARHMRHAQNYAFRQAGLYWHRTIRPKHFKLAAVAEYDYERRTAKYQKRKQKKHHHCLPLVWTGESRGRSRMYTLRATYKRFRLTMSAPKLNLRRNREKQSMADELRSWSRRDTKAIGDRFAKDLDKDLTRSGSAGRASFVRLRQG